MSSGIDGEVVLGLLLVLLGLSGVVWECVQAARALLTARWPSVDGTVVADGVLTHMEMPWRVMGGNPLGPTTVSKPVIRYTYRVGDRTYTNDRLQFRGMAPGISPRSAHRVADRYTKGQAVKVYVSPRDPNVSVLEPGLHWNHFGGIAGACVALGIGIVVILYGDAIITWVDHLAG